ncbi:nitrate- and nitrite sensing domain-containing protein [Streptomyces sp. NBC_00572]|uniref:sensor histidine kinase n=1 Tax=Streptomyces sp. NBC_00572 TaxID=2903664 RepID=UPI00224D45B2|nr:nitrate- and nitrite sensing domain-containing protein [Streptomyces sp. NBC_00572]MCX4983442.1 nitrate- and nitrite sensing domain-containing protein [Streptomyces sp. NBC_00572]
MRAPVQMKRPRSKNGTRSQTPGAASTPDGGAATAPTGNAATGHPVQPQAPAQPKPPAGRPKRVRNRLVAGVALVGITVIVAGSPAILAASAELNDSQSLVTLAELDRQAVTLAHSLADERDEVVAYIAAGRDAQSGTAKNKRQITSTRSTRVDRQIDEIRPAASAELRRDLAGVPSVRRAALTGKGTALEAHRAYSEVITKLQALADELADKTPARASDTALTEATRAPAALGRAVEQASATRGLLLAALSVSQPEPTGDVHYDPETGTYVPDVPEGAAEADRARDTLTAAAQQARVRELAALGDFDQAAGATARDSLAATVAGPDVKSAERSLATLTDQPRLTDTERETDPAGLEAALSARIEQMRGVESALAAERVERLGALRDDDVTALELRIAFLGGCLLVAVGISTYVARTLTRPLAVLRIGAARLAAAPAPHTEEPVRFTGRNDEFAQVVRSLNTLRGKLSDLAVQNERLTERLTDGQADLAAAKDALGAELATQRAELQGQVALLTADLEGLRGTVHHTFVNLSLRSLGLVERQLGVIEKLEEREQDPDRLATLFKLDHMATVMRRHSENLLVLAGHEHVHGHPGPVPLVDVLRAAVSEIERYERVTIQSLPPHAQIAGFAADDLSHLVAELLENATSFSPPDAEVQLSGWLLESGEVMLSVQDAGIGMTASRLAELNARLAEADPAAFEGEGLGMRVVALLAARHGVRVELREQQPGGTAAVVVLPQPLLPAALPTTVTEPVRVAGAAPTLHLPGSAAEANSNTLPSRTRDPLVEAAERAFMAAEVTAAREQQSEQELEPSYDEPETEPAYGETAYGEPAYGETEPAHEENEETEPAYEEAVPAPAALGESVSETTLQVRLPDPPPEPDAHERATDLAAAELVTDLVTDPAPYEEPPAPAAPEPVSDQPVPGPRAAQWERVTDKGLPKRTPQVVRPAGPATTPRQGGVDAEALRRRLGGFHQGAKAGRRDVEAEMDTARTEAVRTARTEEMTGDTVEEARS